MAGKEELSNYKKTEVVLRRYAENTAREITELRKKLICKMIACCESNSA